MSLQLQGARSSSRAHGGECSPAGGCWDELAPLTVLGFLGPICHLLQFPGACQEWEHREIHPHQLLDIPGSSGRGWRCPWRGLGSSGQPWCLSAACRLSGPAHLLPDMLPITVARQAHVSCPSSSSRDNVLVLSTSGLHCCLPCQSQAGPCALSQIRQPL